MEASADPKSENLQYASDILRWISGADPVPNHNAATGAEHCPILAGEEEYYGACEFLPPTVKKRRLGADQIQFLERSFDEDNKLEPERKLRLAKDLGLQPRQVAVWFQNRRARSKTKNLEKEYGALKSRYDGLRADHERLVAENSRLEKELTFLKEKLRIEEVPVNVVKRKEVSRKMLSESKAASSVRSGVSDSNSPYYAEMDRRAWLAPAKSSSRVLAAQDEQFWSWDLNWF